MTTSDNHLCKQCSHIFTTDSTTKIEVMVRDKETKEFLPMAERAFPGGTHHSSAYECEAAARAGCPICLLVWRHLVGDKKELMGQPGVFTNWVAKKGSVDGSQAKYDENLWILQIVFKGLDYGQGAGGYTATPDCAFAFALLPESDISPLMLGFTHDTSTGSSESRRFTEKCLKNCLENHPKCRDRAGQPSHYLPTRLIEVKGSEGSGVVKLRERHEIPKDSEYIALSHCWGQHPLLTLVDPSLPGKTDSSVPIEEFKSGISLTRLPATFRQAVLVTSSMGISYLWIDAICIIQNSSEDWSAESLTMNGVYSSAFCTLAATFSYDGNGGLFNPRIPASVNPVFVQPVWAGDSDTKRLVRPLDFWQVHISDAPLNQRGWVLQERVLSRRIIHFGMNQILWECNTIDCCESFPEGLPQVAGDTSSRFKGLDVDTDGSKLMKNALNDFELGQLLNKDEADVIAASSSELQAKGAVEADVNQGIQTPQNGYETGLEGYYLWSQVLEKYTATSLTKDSDKLVAIAGMIKHFQTFLRDDCASGLWRSILPSQLLWKVEDNAQVSTFVHPDLVRVQWKKTGGHIVGTVKGARPEEWRAPTWSWASIDGQIAAPPPSRDPGLISVDGIMVPEEQRPSGGVPDDSNVNFIAEALVVHGSLHVGRLFYNPQILRWGVAIHPVGMCMERPPGREFENAEMTTDEISPESMSHPESLTQAVAYPDTDLPTEEPHFVLCLPVLKTSRRKALRGDNLSTREPNFAGLLLRLDQRRGPGVYERMGCFHVMQGGSMGKKLTTNQCLENLYVTEKHILLV